MRAWQRAALDFCVRYFKASELADRADFFVSIFERFLEPASAVLDIGGGWGFYHEPLRKRGHFPVVLDVVKPEIQKAPVVIYDGKRIPFPDKSFDVSLFITVLHHIPVVEDVLREARRVTRNRILVVEDVFRSPMGAWWTQMRDRILNFEYVGHPCNFKSRDSWSLFFRSVGLEVEHYEEVSTKLAGFKILNGLFSLRV